jgi:hypothetical protein
MFTFGSPVKTKDTATRIIISIRRTESRKGWDYINPTIIINEIRISFGFLGRINNSD